MSMWREKVKINVKGVYNYMKKYGKRCFIAPAYTIRLEGDKLHLQYTEWGWYPRDVTFPVDELPSLYEFEALRGYYDGEMDKKRILGKLVFVVHGYCDEVLPVGIRPVYGYVGKYVLMATKESWIYYRDDKISFIVDREFIMENDTPEKVFGRLLKKYFPWATPGSITAVGYSISAGVMGIVYRNSEKFIRTRIIVDKEKVEIMYVPYRDGVYNLTIPITYSGPDPLALEYAEHLPPEIEREKVLEHPLLKIAERMYSAVKRTPNAVMNLEKILALKVGENIVHIHYFEGKKSYGFVKVYVNNVPFDEAMVPELKRKKIVSPEGVDVYGNDPLFAQFRARLSNNVVVS
jgi:hypothetical protein